MANERMPGNPAESKRIEKTGIDNIVRQHMEDPNHVITDEDIRNVEIGNFEDNEQENGEGQTTGEVEANNEENSEDNTPKSVPNPWDVVE